MNALVVGSGGREHAIVHALQKSPKLERVFTAPGNGGTPNNVPIRETEIRALADFASENKCFTLVGPEVPLSQGIADEFSKRGLEIFAPSRAAARLESSKSWAKDFMSRHGIPTAEYGVFEDGKEALEFAASFKYEVAIKADGLAAGKGVVVCNGRPDAESAVKSILGGEFGDAGSQIVVERRMSGPEASFIAMCDGKTHVPLATSQDHKRAGDGDAGPNTGGMGAYSPAPVVDAETEAKLNEIISKTVSAMAAEGCPFVGFLYAGVILEDGVPRILEFNARMGDPECQAILPRMESDLYEYAHACATGSLEKMPPPKWSANSCACVVLASKGYPKKYPTGEKIFGLGDASGMANVYHAGTKGDGGNTITNGGRVLGISYVALTLAGAIAGSYAACEKISWPSKYCRTDIGKRIS